MTKDELIKEVLNMRKFNYTLTPDEVFLEILKAINTESTKHGKWVFTPTTGRYRCSVCEKEDKIIPWGKPPFDYCPNCGARMDGGENE